MEKYVKEYFEKNIKGKTEKQIAKEVKILNKNLSNEQDKKNITQKITIIDYIDFKVFNKIPLKVIVTGNQCMVCNGRHLLYNDVHHTNIIEDYILGKYDSNPYVCPICLQSFNSNFSHDENNINDQSKSVKNQKKSDLVEKFNSYLDYSQQQDIQIQNNDFNSKKIFSDDEMEQYIKEFYVQNIEGKTKEEVNLILKNFTTKCLATGNEEIENLHKALIDYISHKIFHTNFRGPYLWFLNTKLLKICSKSAKKFAKVMKKGYKDKHLDY